MTADVKAVLTEALAAALASVHPFGVNAGGKYPEWFREWIAEAVPKAADAILALSGVAVIQLPEPDRAWAKWDAWTVDDSYVVAAATGVVYLEDDESVTALPVATAQRLSERLAAAAAAVLSGEASGE